MHDAHDPTWEDLLPPQTRADLETTRGVAALLDTVARTTDRVGDLVRSWLASRSNSVETHSTYLIDIREFFRFCVEKSFDPLTMRIQDADHFKPWLAAQVSQRTGRPYSHAYARRKINAVSSFFEYLVEVDARDRNPITRHARLSETRVRKLSAVDAAAAARIVQASATGYGNLGGLCARLIVDLLFNVGLRASTIAGIDLDDLVWTEIAGRRMRAVRLWDKGNIADLRPIPAEVDEHALTPYLATRPIPASPVHDRALLLTLAGIRVTRYQITRAATSAGEKAGIDKRVTGHSGRHTYERTARLAGVPLERRQKDFNHASMDTTLRYGQDEDDLAADGTHVVAAIVYAAMGTDPDPSPDPDAAADADDLTGSHQQE